jgi:hypothetical protein
VQSVLSCIVEGRENICIYKYISHLSIVHNKTTAHACTYLSTDNWIISKFSNTMMILHSVIIIQNAIIYYSASGGHC